MSVGSLVLLVIKVVEQAHHPPQLWVLAELLGVAAHGGLDGQHVRPEVLAVGVLDDQGPGVCACLSLYRHGVLLTDEVRFPAITGRRIYTLSAC
jgi:hypothetical protein